MDQTTIRKAGTRDLSFLHEIVDLFDQRDPPAALYGWSADADLTLVLEENGKLIGAVWSRPPPVSGYREVYIGIVKMKRSRGLGRRLLSELVSRMESGSEEEGLSARINPLNEPARSLFRSQGFSTKDDWTWTMDFKNAKAGSTGREHHP